MPLLHLGGGRGKGNCAKIEMMRGERAENERDDEEGSGRGIREEGR
jgi:hypothetical protein